MNSILVFPLIWLFILHNFWWSISSKLMVKKNQKSSL